MPTSTSRPSKFIEGSETIAPDMHSQAQTNNQLLFTILCEMDEFESRRRRQEHRNSHSSVDSLPSSNGGNSPTSSPIYTSHPIENLPFRAQTVKEGRRSINFSSPTRGRSGSASGGYLQESEEEAAKIARKFVGRLRALTGGREKDTGREIKAYAGT